MAGQSSRRADTSEWNNDIPTVFKVMIPAETQPAASRNSYSIPLAFSERSVKEETRQMLGEGLYPKVFTVQSLHPSEKCLPLWCCPVRCSYLSALKLCTSVDGRNRKQREKKGKLFFAWEERKDGYLKLKGLAWGHVDSQWHSPE